MYLRSSAAWGMRLRRTPGCRNGLVILHVDDHASIREAVRRVLEARGSAVASADSVRAAKQALGERDDLVGVLLDVELCDGNGLDVYDWIAEHRPTLAERVAFVTGNADNEAWGRLSEVGCPILYKPFDIA